MQRLREILTKLTQFLLFIIRIERTIDDIKINQGRILAELQRRGASGKLADHEFKVFSQTGEDGVIQHLIHQVEIPNKTFIEFGVADFSESNCRFLLMKDQWSGFVIDGAQRNIDRIRSSYYYWQHQLQAVCAFITRENINDLLRSSGFDPDLGLLSVDIDGNDYHVLEAIDAMRPRILIVEYNAVFGPERPISVLYDPSFSRFTAHASGMYWGASLNAFTLLARRKGYSLVGTTRSGLNAFFVRDDVRPDSLPALSAQEAFTASVFQDTRDRQGRLNHLRGDARRQALVDDQMMVLNVATGQAERL